MPKLRETSLDTTLPHPYSDEFGQGPIFEDPSETEELKRYHAASGPQPQKKLAKIGLSEAAAPARCASRCARL
jgi:hypothetical protein